MTPGIAVRTSGIACSQVNLKSVYACTRAVVPYLLERGGGSIVNTASIAASCCVGGAAYAASKGGMISYTRHVSHELGRATSG